MCFTACFTVFPVELIEQRLLFLSPAHHTDMFAELVCSNSLKSTKEDSWAAGTLKSEFKKMGGFLLRIAEENSVPGGALAVNREDFSRLLLSRSEIIQTSR